MIFYVFYKPNSFDSVAALRYNRATAERAEAAAHAELSESIGARILYTLPGSDVCPRCWHPWNIHQNGCTYQHELNVDGVLHQRPCCCTRRAGYT